MCMCCSCCLKFVPHCRLFNALCSVFAISMPFFAVGSCLSWTSPVIPKLKEESWIEVTEYNISWIGSLLMLGAAVGAYFAEVLLDFFGRRITLIIDIFILMFSWIILFWAQPLGSLSVIYIGRFISGIGTGVAFASIPLYVNEISELSIRNAMGSLSEVFLGGGYLLEYTTGPFVTYKSLCVISSLVLVFSLLLFIKTPESPHYLIHKGRREEALAVLSWLRGDLPQNEIDEELEEIETLQDVRRERQHSMKDLIMDRANLKALLVCCGLSFFQQFSGINVMLAYAEPIFEEASSAVSASLSAVIVGIVQFITALCTPVLANFYGFKVLLVVSAFFMCLSQGLLGLYFFLLEMEVDLHEVQFLPIICAMIYIIAYCLGFGPLVWAVMGEIYNPSVKEIGTSTSTCFNWFLAFIVTKCFANITELIGFYFAFWLFATCCLFAFFFTIFVVPNTKGLTLAEIQEVLHGMKSAEVRHSKILRKRPSR